MERWRLNLYTIWFSQVISLMSFGFGLPFMPFYIQELGVVDPVQLKLYTGLLNAAPAITMGIMAPIWGMAADRWGKKWMLIRAVVSAVFILLAMGLVTRVEQLIVLRFIQGLFTGTVTASSALVASSTPSNRHSYSLGFLSSSTFIGFSAGPAIGGFVAESLGYRISFFIGAALMLVDVFLVLFLVKETKTPIPSPVPLPKDGSKISILKALSPTIIIMLIVLLFMRISRTVFNPYLPLFIQSIRDSTEGNASITGVVNSITGLMTAASGLTLSRLGDRYNKITLLSILLSAGILISLPLSWMGGLWSFAALYGILFFAIGGIEPVVTSLNSESIPPERRGMLFGIQAMVGSIGWALSPLLGSTVSIKFSIRHIFYLIPAALSFALVTLILFRLINRRNSVQKI